MLKLLFHFSPFYTSKSRKLQGMVKVKVLITGIIIIDNQLFFKASTISHAIHCFDSHLQNESDSVLLCISCNCTN